MGRRSSIGTAGCVLPILDEFRQDGAPSLRSGHPSDGARARGMGSAASLHAGDAVTIWYDGVPERGTVTSATPFVQVILQDERGATWTKTLTPLDCWLHGWYADSDYEVAKRTAPLTTTIERLRRGPQDDSGTPAAARRHNSQAVRAQEQLLVPPHVRRDPAAHVATRRFGRPPACSGPHARWGPSRVDAGERLRRRLPKAAEPTAVPTACAYLPGV